MRAGTDTCQRTMKEGMKPVGRAVDDDEATGVAEDDEDAIMMCEIIAIWHNRYLSV